MQLSCLPCSPLTVHSAANRVHREVRESGRMLVLGSNLVRILFLLARSMSFTLYADTHQARAHRQGSRSQCAPDSDKVSPGQPSQDPGPHPIGQGEPGHRVHRAPAATALRLPLRSDKTRRASKSRLTQSSCLHAFYLPPQSRLTVSRSGPLIPSPSSPFPQHRLQVQHHSQRQGPSVRRRHLCLCILRDPAAGVLSLSGLTHLTASAPSDASSPTRSVAHLVTAQDSAALRPSHVHSYTFIRVLLAALPLPQKCTLLNSPSLCQLLTSGH